MIRYVAEQDPQERRETGQRARAYMAARKTWDIQTQNAAQFIRDVVLRPASRSGETPQFPGIDLPKTKLAQKQPGIPAQTLTEEVAQGRAGAGPPHLLRD